MIWLVIANAFICTVYEFEYTNQKVFLIDEILHLIHPESKLKGQDLIADKPGHYKTREQTRGMYIPPEEPKKHEIKRFAKEVGNFLNVEKRRRHFKKIILIGPSKFMGLLYSELEKETVKCIIQTIHKNFTFLTTPEIIACIKENFNFHTLRPKIPSRTVNPFETHKPRHKKKLKKARVVLEKKLGRAMSKEYANKMQKLIKGFKT